MKYPRRLDDLLRPRRAGRWRVVDLFAGCGGLSLGFEAAGFNVVGYEQDEDACATYGRNLRGLCHHKRLTCQTRLPKCARRMGVSIE